MIGSCPTTPVVQLIYVVFVAGIVGPFSPVLPWAVGDTVSVRPLAPGKPVTRVRGDVVRFSRRELVLRVAESREQSVPAEQVIAVETDWHPRHEQALSLHADGRFDDAFRAYKDAMREETREWVKRRMESECVRLLEDQGQILFACQLFLRHCRTDPETPYRNVIPLAWRSTPVSPDHEQAANEWLKGESAESRLLGASWLLGGASRDQARKTLEEMTSKSDDLMTRLAGCQLWRLQWVTASREQVDSWRVKVEKLPKDVRGGPYFLLGQGLARHAQHEEAALTLLHVALDTPRRSELAADALLLAARQLETLGQIQEARRLYREIVSAYAGATAVVSAQARLKDLAVKERTEPPQP